MDEKLEQKVRESGHNLHLDVADYLKQENWNVELASYYVDDLSDKPREIDIIAELPFCRENFETDSPEEILRTRLFIECKYFKNPIALRTLPVDLPETQEAIIVYGMTDPGKIFFDWHHYAQPRVTKLWTTMDDRNDSFFDGLAGSTKSLLYYLGTRASRGLFYPVLVYDGIDGMFEIKGNDLSNLASASVVKRAIVSFNYAYTEVFTNKPKRRRLFVDIIHRKELPSFINEVVSEGKKAMSVL